MNRQRRRGGCHVALGDPSDVAVNTTSCDIAASEAGSRPSAWVSHSGPLRDTRLDGPARHRADRGQGRTLTARATTSAMVESAIADWASISIFAHRDSGIVSVGEKAVAFV